MARSLKQASMGDGSEVDVGSIQYAASSCVRKFIQLTHVLRLNALSYQTILS